MMHLLAARLVLLTIGTVLFALALEWWYRHASLQRLQMVLGEIEDAPAPKREESVLDRMAARLPRISDQELRAALARAGFHQSWAPPAFAALRLSAMASVFCLAVIHEGGLADPVRILPAMGLSFLCGRISLILLKARGEARQWEIRRELPPVIDILLMVLNSGASVDQCLRYVTGILEGSAPLVSAIFKRCLADLDGGVPYEAALDRLGQRLGIEEGHDLAALIKQALLQGGEIVGSLDRFGAELSEKRLAAAREQIGRKAIQLTIVMLVFFMPVLMIVLAGPAVSNIFETLATVKHQVHAKEVRQ